MGWCIQLSLELPVRKQSCPIAIAASFTPENRMLVRGEIHNGHREELEKIIAADRGRTESFLESFLSEKLAEDFLMKAASNP